MVIVKKKMESIEVGVENVERIVLEQSNYVWGCGSWQLSAGVCKRNFLVGRVVRVSRPDTAPVFASRFGIGLVLCRLSSAEGI